MCKGIIDRTRAVFDEKSQVTSPIGRGDIQGAFYGVCPGGKVHHAYTILGGMRGASFLFYQDQFREFTPSFCCDVQRPGFLAEPEEASLAFYFIMNDSAPSCADGQNTLRRRINTFIAPLVDGEHGDVKWLFPHVFQAVEVVEFVRRFRAWEGTENIRRINLLRCGATAAGYPYFFGGGGPIPAQQYISTGAVCL